MRAFFFFSSVALALATAGTPAVAANATVTVTNASIYTASVTVRRDGKDIGRALIHTKRHVTIGVPVDPSGGTVAVGLTLGGKPVCKLAASIASPVTKWVVTGDAAAPGSLPKCALRRA